MGRLLLIFLYSSFASGATAPLPCAIEAVLATSPRASDLETDVSALAYLAQPHTDEQVLPWILLRFEPLVRSMCGRFGFAAENDVNEIRANFSLALWQKRMEYDPAISRPNTWVGNLAFYAAANLSRQRDLNRRYHASLTGNPAEEAEGSAWDAFADGEVGEPVDDLLSRERAKEVAEFLRSRAPDDPDAKFLRVLLGPDSPPRQALIRGRTTLRQARALYSRIREYSYTPLTERAWRLYERRVPLPEIGEFLDLRPEEALHLIDARLVANSLVAGGEASKERPEIVVLSERVVRQQLASFHRLRRQLTRRILLREISSQDLSRQVERNESSLSSDMMWADATLRRYVGRTDGPVHFRIIPQALVNRHFGVRAKPDPSVEEITAGLRGWRGDRFYCTEAELRGVIDNLPPPRTHRDVFERRMRVLRSYFLARTPLANVGVQVNRDAEGLYADLRGIFLLVGPKLTSEKPLAWTKLVLIDDEVRWRKMIHDRYEDQREQGILPPELELTATEFDYLCPRALHTLPEPTRVSLCAEIKDLYLSLKQPKVMKTDDLRAFQEAKRQLAAFASDWFWLPELTVEALAVIEDKRERPPFFYLERSEWDRILLQVKGEPARIVGRLYYEHRFSYQQISRILGTSYTASGIQLRENVLSQVAKALGQPRLLPEQVVVCHPDDEAFNPTPPVSPSP